MMCPLWTAITCGRCVGFLVDLDAVACCTGENGLPLVHALLPDSIGDHEDDSDGGQQKQGDAYFAPRHDISLFRHENTMGKTKTLGFTKHRYYSMMFRVEIVRRAGIARD